MGGAVELAGGERISAAAVIGAGGGRWVVRSRIGGEGEPPVSGHMCYRAVLKVDEMPKDLRWAAATLWAGHNTHIVHYPLRGWKLFNLVATVVGKHATGAHNEEAPPEEVLPLFAHNCDKPMSIMRVPQMFRRWMLRFREPVDNWSAGPVTLLGDAAHFMLQYFAQGAAMALEDAVCLAAGAARHASYTAGAAREGFPGGGRAPASPPAITPKSVARPVSTACAPSARAFRMSTPRRTPPSSSTVIFEPTARTTAGSASRLGAAPSSWRPPWLDTTTPSQPIARARSASSGRSTPLRRGLRGPRSRRRLRDSPSQDASISRPTAVALSVPAGLENL